MKFLMLNFIYIWRMKKFFIILLKTIGTIVGILVVYVLFGYFLPFI